MNSDKYLRLFNFVLKCITLILLSFYVSVSCSYINRKFNIKDDHLVEELIESVIEKETGISIDLTPDSIE